MPDRNAPGIRSQLTRAVMSIAANVAEGASRDTRTDFARFISIAIASASEVEHHLTVCVDLAVLDPVIASLLIDKTVEVRRMLFGLRRVLIMRVSEEHALYDAFSPGTSKLVH